MRLGRLFSDHFLREGIQGTEAYQRLLADVGSVAELRAHLVEAFDRFPAVTRPDEAQTEQDLIFRVLEAIGWSRDAWLVQPRAARQGRTDVPDMLFFADAATKALALAEADHGRRYEHGLAVVENKRWDRPLDRGAAGVRRGDEEREVPSTQMLRYLSRAETLSNRRIQFGILTNGRLWRLYYQGARSRSEEFFELDLPSLLLLATMAPDLLAPPPAERDHWLRVFLLLFGCATFIETDTRGRTFHFLALDEGRLWEERVAKDLSQLVFRDLFPRLVQALDAADPRRPTSRTPAYLRELRDGALTLLYRALFVLYAEDRGLLPVRDRRYDDYSLAVIREDIARRIDEGDTFSARALRYDSHLRHLFRAIDEGELTLGIPPYNGGLFDSKRHDLLERAHLSDAVLAPVLDRLSRITVEDRPRRINYSDLSVQQLGSIYERLLEHEVVEQDGAVAIAIDDTGRHGSGSYYTPEVLVQLILERTLGPIVKDCITAFEARAKALASDHRPKAERLAELAALDPATLLLELKICDPAMGSGHFLVSAVDLLADRVLEAIAAAPRIVTFAAEDQPYESPLVARIATIRARILANAKAGSWKVDDAQLDDRRLVRRMILKRAIHGVDKNPMAVELAKVALWLHTFTVGAPLSFLDHHLRAGDSLLGLWVADAERIMVERGGLLPGRHVVQAQLASTSMARIEEITDSDITEVEDSAHAYEAVKEATAPLAALLSLLQAERLIGVFDAAPRRRPSESRRTARYEAELCAWNRAHALEQVLDGSLGDPIALARGALRLAPDPVSPHLAMAQELIDEAMRLSEAHRFTHWQLALPNIWSDWISSGRQGGFDAVVGNPPYVRQEQLGALKPALKKAFEAYDGMADLYVYFYELGLRLLRPGGRLSYVVTNKWFRAGYAEELRDLFAEATWLEAVVDFGHVREFFPDADVFPCIVVARKPSDAEPPTATAACRIPREVVRLDRVSEQVAEMSVPVPRLWFSRTAWVIEPPAEMALLVKLRRNGVPLKEYAGVKPYRGVLTGCNEAFLVDTLTRDALVAADPGCAEIIKPYLRGQDIDRWHAPWAGLWMIFARRGIEIERYPSVLAHLQRFRSMLEPRPADWDGNSRDWSGRKPGSYRWFELQDAVEYWEEFAEPKVIYQEIQYHSCFAFDLKCKYLNNKAFMISSADAFLLGALNSPLMWWHNWRTLPHLKDEALSPMGYMVETLPIAQPTRYAREQANQTVESLAAIHGEASAARGLLADWYRDEHGIDRPSRALVDPFALDATAFVAAVRAARGRRRPLSPAEVRAVRDAWRDTVASVQERLRKAERLERELSDLVNAAYGLTPEEVQLMWQTAPPRMPLAAPDVIDSDMPLAAIG